MKQIVRLGNGKYVHLDSYGESIQGFLGCLVTPAVILIAGITVGALFGADVIKPIHTQTQVIK